MLLLQSHKPPLLYVLTEDVTGPVGFQLCSLPPFCPPTALAVGRSTELQTDCWAEETAAGG